MPFLIRTVLILTLVSAAFGELSILGFNLKGWAWVATLAVAIQTLASLKTRPAFPFWIWAPWVALLTGYLVVSRFENALQRTVIMICPILIATAVSKLRVDQDVMELVYRRLKQGAIVLTGIFLVRSGFGLTGMLPDTTGLAAEVMTGNVFAGVFAAAYALGVPEALRYWSTMAVLPVIAVTRTVAVATGLSLASTLAPLALSRRVVAVLLVAGSAFLIFQTDRVQKKMFYSGKGQIQDLVLENRDFRTTGRLWMWQLLDEEIRRRPWWGHGANAQEAFILKVIAVRGQPHNDWKRLLFDYGYFGAGTFGVTILFQMLHAWLRGARGASLPLVTRVLFFSGASSFLSFTVIMLTDNIILYSSFFGNLHFALLGLAYASAEERREANRG